jgi:cyclase
MRRTVLLPLLAVVFGGATLALMQTPARPAHRFTKVTDTLYGALGTGAMNVGSNAGVIINDKDVLIVDSHITPAAARALATEIQTLTDKPIRYVVNTHFHFDHAHGNQVFPDDVLIIGHEFTREKLAGDPLNEPSFKSFTSGVPAQVENLRKDVAAETDPAKQKTLKDRLDVQSAYADALKEVKPIPPNVTVRNKMTLFRGGREIQILFFGRGHTGGDVVVFLPREKVLFSGDLFVPNLGFMGDGYLDEWIVTLDELKKLDFETVVPGHGEVLVGSAAGHERIGFVQAYMKDLWAQVNALKSQGVPPADAAKKVDLTSHKTQFAQLTAPGVDARAVARIYQVIDERARR